MRLSIAESNKLAEIYTNKVLVEDMTDGGVLGGGGGDSPQDMENGDDYAKGDNRIPYVIGKIQTRRDDKNRRGKKKYKKLPFLAP